MKCIDIVAPKRIRADQAQVGKMYLAHPIPGPAPFVADRLYIKPDHVRDAAGNTVFLVCIGDGSRVTNESFGVVEVGVELHRV